MKINELQEGSDREYLNLPKEEIERLRAKFLPDWEYKDNSLQKKYKFEDYFEVIRFLINTIKPQEKLDHHADLGVFYDEVLVKIYTHRTNDVSDYDFMVAMQIDMIAKAKHGAINPNYNLNKLVDEGTRCWKGYEKKGMKTMFGKRVPNCVKREGKYFVHEHPASAVSWDEREMVKLMAHRNVTLTKADQCMYGRRPVNYYTAAGCNAADFGCSCCPSGACGGLRISTVCHRT